MKDILKLGGILLLVTAIAGAALSMVNSITKPKIEYQKQLIAKQALQAAIPSANPDLIEEVKENEQVIYYIGYGDSSKQAIAGYAFLAKQPGYSSVIETMVGVDTTGKILGIKIIAQTETPGLGTKITEVKYGQTSSWFQDQFVNQRGAGLAVDKDGGQIKSITGATISSRAVTVSIKNGLETLENRIGGFKTKNDSTTIQS